MVARGDAFLEIDEDFGIFWVVRSGDLDAFFGVISKNVAVVLLHLAENLVFFEGEVEYPGVGGAEIFGFFAIFAREPVGGDFCVHRLYSDKDYVFLPCEPFYGFVCGLRGTFFSDMWPVW